MGINGNVLQREEKSAASGVRHTSHAASGISGTESARTWGANTPRLCPLCKHPVCTRENPRAMAADVATPGLSHESTLLYTFLALHPESGTLNLLRETPVTRGDGGWRMAGGGARETGVRRKRTPGKLCATDSDGKNKRCKKVGKKMSERRGGGRARRIREEDESQR